MRTNAKVKRLIIEASIKRLEVKARVKDEYIPGETFQKYKKTHPALQVTAPLTSSALKIFSICSSSSDGIWPLCLRKQPAGF